MRLCRFGEGRLGVLEENTVRDVTDVLDVLPTYRYPFPPGDSLATFLPAIVTIPLVGTQRTLIGAAAVIAAAACLLLGWKWVFVPVVLAGLIAIPPGAVKAAAVRADGSSG